MANTAQAERFPICQPEPLEALFTDTGLKAVSSRSLEIPTVFRNFDGYWKPFLTLLDHMRNEHFIRPGLELKIDVAGTPKEAVARFLLNMEKKEPEPVPLKPVRQQM